MRGVVLGLLAAALCSCAPSVQDVSLAGLDLADGETLAALQNALPQDDRAALGTYALLHWPKSKFYCGRPIGGRAAGADTVGEAIALTRAYETALELAQRSEAATASVAKQTEERTLVTKMEQLVLERDMLFARAGPAASDIPRVTEIKHRLAQLRAELRDVRAEPAG